jgi:hypothetical protein
MRYLKAITALALLSLILIGCASAACPTIESVKVFKNNQYIGTCGTYKVSVGNNIAVQVCCKNTDPYPATLFFTWIDGRTYKRTIKAGTSSQCEMFYFQINSRILTSKCVQRIGVKSNSKTNCGQESYCRPCFYTG